MARYILACRVFVDVIENRKKYFFIQDVIYNNIYIMKQLFCDTENLNIANNFHIFFNQKFTPEKKIHLLYVPVFVGRSNSAAFTFIKILGKSYSNFENGANYLVNFLIHIKIFQIA